MMTISEAVRRAAQKLRTGEEEEKLAPGWAVDVLRLLLGDRVLAGLVSGAHWSTKAARWSCCSGRGTRRETGEPPPPGRRPPAGCHLPAGSVLLRASPCCPAESV